MSQHDPLPPEDTGCGILSIIVFVSIVFALALAVGVFLGWQ
jgi:hypothetical protein